MQSLWFWSVYEELKKELSMSKIRMDGFYSIVKHIVASDIMTFYNMTSINV